MRDTTPAMEAEYNRRIMALSPGRRMAIACEMFGTAKALARASILHDGPKPEHEVRRQLFLHFYGDDFSEAERARILDYLAAT